MSLLYNNPQFEIRTSPFPFIAHRFPLSNGVSLTHVRFRSILWAPTSWVSRSNLVSTTTVAVQLHEPLFRRLKRAADLTHRSVEEIAATSLEAVLPPASNLPPDIADELATMHLFSDEALWAATEPSLSPAEERRLAQLNSAAGERELTPAEESEQQNLITAFQRSVLRRAKALAILAQRGHPIAAATEDKIPGNAAK